MATVISSRKLANGGLLTVERRTRRTVIETTVDGQRLLTAEQEDVTFVDGEIVAAPVPAGILMIPNDELAVNPDIPVVEQKLVAAIDAKRVASPTAEAAEVAEKV